MTPKSRKEGKAAGATFYFTNSSCANGHVSERYVSTAQCVACLQSWTDLNKSKVKQAKRVWKSKNPDKVREACRNQKRRQAHDPTYKVNRNMRAAIWRNLKRFKGGRGWETLVSFTLEELQAHLERQFQPDMTWGNYGAHWEIDHINPLSKCESFEEAWALTNLQPLVKFENRSKGGRWATTDASKA